MSSIPQTQYAVQLIAPGQLRLNTEKPVFKPGPHQILAKIECVGLCFSDLKLLKQFDQHVRKSQIVSGLESSILQEIPSYVPGDKPTVPGHEVTCRIVAVGEKVRHHKVGERCVVQADYRALRTAGSNAAFGYNFEGALQEYVLLDERVVVDSTGQRYLIPAPEDSSASAVALVEPWACVEDSYVTYERRTIKTGGRLLIVADEGAKLDALPEMCRRYGLSELTAICGDDSQRRLLGGLPVGFATVSRNLAPAALQNESFDDIIYFGANNTTIDALNDKLAAGGILNVVLGGKKIGKPVLVGVGRVHYGGTRWIGTTGDNPEDAYRVIPRTGEIRPNDNVVIVGAGGPMGQMHVIRAVCSGIEGISVVGTDMDDARLDAIARKANPMAKANGVELRMVNTAKTQLSEKFRYFALMAPIGALVANAIRDSMPGCLINIFAGIPAPTKQEIDLDTYIANRCFMFGTSGSTINDMKIVLEKVTGGRLDTNASVDAVSGMAGATDGIAAVENRTLAGKIIVYPSLHELGLTPLSELGAKFPSVAEKLDNGRWSKAAEQELLRVAK